MLNLLFSPILDRITRDNFRKIQELNDNNPLIDGDWVLREYNITGAVTQQKFPHGLSFLPKDVILTYITGAGVLTIHYAQIDTTNLVLSTTAACDVRLLVGRLGA